MMAEACMELTIPLQILQACCHLDPRQKVTLTTACHRGNKDADNIDDVEIRAEIKDNKVVFMLQAAATLGTALKERLIDLWKCEVQSMQIHSAAMNSPCDQSEESPSVMDQKASSASCEAVSEVKTELDSERSTGSHLECDAIGDDESDLRDSSPEDDSPNKPPKKQSLTKSPKCARGRKRKSERETKTLNVSSVETRSNRRRSSLVEKTVDEPSPKKDRNSTSHKRAPPTDRGPPGNKQNVGSQRQQSSRKRGPSPKMADTMNIKTESTENAPRTKKKQIRTRKKNHDKMVEAEILSKLETCELKDLQCTYCNRTWFPSISMFKRHVHRCFKLTGGGTEELKIPYVCTMCNAGFYKYTTLVSHYVEAHNEKVEDSKPQISTDGGSTAGIHDKSCPYCNRSWFVSQKTYIRHTHTCEKNPLIKNTESKPFQCDICFYRVTSDERLKRHRKDVHKISAKERKPTKPAQVVNALDVEINTKIATCEVKDLVCKFCDRNWFPNSTIYKRHVHLCYKSTKGGTEQPKAPFVCPTCKAGFSKYDGLNKHCTNIHGIKAPIIDRQSIARKRTPGSYPCQFCGRVFSWYHSIKNHTKYRCRLNPNLVKAVYCNICSALFDNREDLKKHLASSHHEGTQFVCALCGMSFKSRSGMYFHKLRAHNEGKPYKFSCHICQNTFLTRTRLETHLTKHFDERNYTCEHCGKSFKNTAQVQYHIKSIHQNKYPYQCLKCGHGVQKRKYLENHVCGRVRRIQGAEEECAVNSLLEDGSLKVAASHSLLEDSSLKVAASVDMGGSSGGVVGTSAEVESKSNKAVLPEFSHILQPGESHVMHRDQVEPQEVTVMTTFSEPEHNIISYGTGEVKYVLLHSVDHKQQ